MTRLLCFGDLQLGLHGRLDDQARALEQIATLAFERNVDVILNGGDTFEGPGITPEQLEVFARFVAACRAIDVPIVATSGNGRHDAALRETNGLAIFDHIPGIAVGVTPRVVELNGGLRVATLPWVHPKRLIARIGAQMPRTEIEQQMADLLVDVASELREQCEGAPSVLLTHFDISGASVPTGLPVDAVSNVVLPLDALVSLSFDAVVASHIHRPQLLNDRPPVFYTGSPLAHDHGEAGFDHGCWILELDGTAAAEFVPLEHPRFVTLVASGNVLATAGPRPDLSLFEHDDEVADAFVRVQYEATAEEQRRIDVPLIRRQLLEAGARSVKVEPTIVRADRARVQGVDEQLDETAALEAWMQSQSVADDLREILRTKTRDYLAVIA